MVFVFNLNAQLNQGIRQLSEVLSNGNVTLTANGNGSSSGPSINGRLRNNTSSEIRINVIITDGLYLRNSGIGQNMIATQVYLGSFEYYASGSQYYINLRPNMETSIVFIAYCANFERNNPSRQESFTTAPTPPDFQAISSRISRYMADNFDDDETTAVQLALWRSQGKSRTEIARTFDFDDYDWNLSAAIMNYQE